MNIRAIEIVLTSIEKEAILCLSAINIADMQSAKIRIEEVIRQVSKMKDACHYSQFRTDSDFDIEHFKIKE